MNEVQDPGQLRAVVRAAQARGQYVGFVPTMGYLHRGHVALVHAAKRTNDLVVMSIFVNPTQFGPHEDLERYPSNLKRDRQMAREGGVDLLFVPATETMYPSGPDHQSVWIDPGPLGAVLEGASRPGHFRGVTTVVTKLLHLVGPDRVYFGQKDAQQSIVVRRMVADLAFPVEVCVEPTVRAPDGLALSSRNVYLSADERRQATVLYRALRGASGMLQAGERDATIVERAVRGTIEGAGAGVAIDYIAIADLVTLAPVRGEIVGDTVVALAVYVGSTRLIDNMLVRFRDGHPEIS